MFMICLGFFYLANQLFQKCWDVRIFFLIRHISCVSVSQMRSYVNLYFRTLCNLPSNTWLLENFILFYNLRILFHDYTVIIFYVGLSNTASPDCSQVQFPAAAPGSPWAALSEPCPCLFAQMTFHKHSDTRTSFVCKKEAPNSAVP